MKQILVIREYDSALGKYNVFDKEIEQIERFKIEGFNVVFEDISTDTIIESFDYYFTVLINKYIKTEFDLIVIPAWLRIPLFYNGFKLAMHWRLTNFTSSRVKMLIYGFEEELSIYKNCSFSIFLNSDKVFYKKFKDLNLHEFLKEFNFEEDKNYDLKGNLKYFSVKPPTNYLTAHSITNEWSILKWATAIGIDKNSFAFRTVENSINSFLYYKYLKAYYGLNDFQNKVDLRLTEKGKILFIDDELKKGWELIFNHICFGINQECRRFMGHDFKNSNNPSDIIENIKETVKEFDPDVVILDLRLHDSDYQNDIEIEETTGYQALNEIKEINKGIQVIILTASNKVWNMQALQRIGADGFIVKEGPENSYDKKFTKKSLENIYKTIDKCFSRSYLKKVYIDFTPIQTRCSNLMKIKPHKYNNKINQGILEDMNAQLEVFERLITFDPFDRRYAFNTIILIFEKILNSCYIDVGTNEHAVEIDLFNKVKCNYLDGTSRKLSITPLGPNEYTSGEVKIYGEDERYYNCAASRAPFNFKLTCVLHYKYNLNLNNEIFKYFELYTIRSKGVAHDGYRLVSKDNILTSLKLLATLIQ